MRNTILTLLLAYSAFCAKAQVPYYAFPDSNAEWRVHSHVYPMGNHIGYDRVYYYTGDTDINGISYHVLTDDGNPVGFLRTDTTGKVFFLKSLTGADNIEHTIYDFSMNIGDSLVNTYYNYFSFPGNYYHSVQVVTDITLITIENSVRRLFELDNGTLWIEGIGDIRGLLPYTYGMNDWEPKLCSFKQNDSTVYYCIGQPYIYCTHCNSYTSVEEENYLGLSIFPNPSPDFCTIQLSTGMKSASAFLFDLTGREVMLLFNNQTLSSFTFNTSVLPQGIYFIKVTEEQGRTATQKLVKE